MLGTVANAEFAGTLLEAGVYGEFVPRFCVLRMGALSVWQGCIGSSSSRVSGSFINDAKKGATYAGS